MKDPLYVRMGTSGGIGAEAGTVVVTTEGVNGMLRPSYSLAILGEMVERPSIFDPLVLRVRVSAKLRCEDLSFKCVLSQPRHTTYQISILIRKRLFLVYLALLNCLFATCLTTSLKLISTVTVTVTMANW